MGITVLTGHLPRVRIYTMEQVLNGHMQGMLVTMRHL